MSTPLAVIFAPVVLSHIESLYTVNIEKRVLRRRSNRKAQKKTTTPKKKRVRVALIWLSRDNVDRPTTLLDYGEPIAYHNTNNNIFNVCNLLS